MLPNEKKDLFMEDVDITNEKMKLRSILEAVDDFSETMMHEEKCRELFKFNFFIGKYFFYFLFFLQVSYPKIKNFGKIYPFI